MTLWWLLFAPACAAAGRARPSGGPPTRSLYFALRARPRPVDGRYPYPFMDVGKLGWLQIAD